MAVAAGENFPPELHQAWFISLQVTGTYLHTTDDICSVPCTASDRFPYLVFYVKSKSGFSSVSKT